MPNGVPTPEEKRNEFAAKYLELNSARGAARAVGLPERTGVDLARELDADPEFTRVRAEQRARVLAEVEGRLLALAATVHERIESPDLTPSQLAELAVQNGLKSFSYQNPKPQYLKGLVDFYKAVAAQRKGEAPSNQSGATQRIEVVLTDGTSDGEPEQ
jgi:hypothetical protein